MTVKPWGEIVAELGGGDGGETGIAIADIDLRVVAKGEEGDAIA